MFVITVDQVASRAHDDLVTRAVRDVNKRYAASLALRAERTAGDEFQLMTGNASTVLDLALRMTRESVWSIGVGVGSVRHPLPAHVREATGDAFYAARTAVERAKKMSGRFALETVDGAAIDGERGAAERDGEVGGEVGGEVLTTRDVEALVDLLLALREKRTDGGWEIADAMASGMSQREAAAQLGISASAASLRVKAAGLRREAAARDALERILADFGRRFDGD